jgi:hypothetical protein
MARANIRSLKKWIRYGQASDANLAKMRQWRDEAMEQMAEQHGGEITSGGANSVNFSREPGLTVDGWSNLLDEALEHIENGTRPTSRTIARLA